jgi:asparagine synthase (glutamine-hydrolysing)
MYRYVALIWNAADAAQRDLARMLIGRLKVSAPRWTEEFHQRGLVVLSADSQPGSLEAHLLAGDAGVIVGAVFERAEPAQDAPCARVVFDERVTSDVVTSRGEWLIRRAWGNYVAFLCRGAAPVTRIIKDPCGELPAFMTTVRGVTLVFSAIADCRAIGLDDFSVNRRFLELHVGGADTTSEVDALNEVTQVRRGEGIEIDPRASTPFVGRRFYWTPVAFPGWDEPIDAPQIAAEVLRNTVHACVGTWAAGHRAALLRLSGGLDSSIVLGCLTRASGAASLMSYTHYTEGDSDPRRWARMAAEFNGCPYVELALDPRATELQDALAVAPTVEPSSALMYVTVGHYEERLATVRGASAVFTGEGGDGLFGSLCTSEAVASFLRRRGPRPAVVRLAARAARVLQQSTVSQLVKGLGSWVKGQPSRTLQSEQRELSKLVARPLIEASSQAAPHPWFNDIDPVPWETVSKLSLLLTTPNPYMAAQSPAGRTAQLISPLYSQPWVELSLRIPADVLFADGRDRGLARRAFADLVPPEILKRQWKDRPGAFHQALIARHVDWLRTMLLDGVLVREGLLDRAAVDHALSARFVKTDVSSAEILRHLDTEIWVRHWS